MQQITKLQKVFKKKKNTSPPHQHLSTQDPGAAQGRREDSTWLCTRGETSLQLGGSDQAACGNDKFTFHTCPCLFGIGNILMRRKSSEGKRFVCRLVLGGVAGRAVREPTVNTQFDRTARVQTRFPGVWQMLRVQFVFSLPQNRSPQAGGP